MKASAVLGTKYWKASHLKGDTKFSIEAVVCESFDNSGQNEIAEEKIVVYFKGDKRGWVLNKTNGDSLIEWFGDETDMWPGHKIVLFPTQTQFGTRTVDCIRCKLPPKPLPVEETEGDDILI